MHRPRGHALPLTKGNQRGNCAQGCQTLEIVQHEMEQTRVLSAHRALGAAHADLGQMQQAMKDSIQLCSQ